MTPQAPIDQDVPRKENPFPHFEIILSPYMLHLWPDPWVSVWIPGEPHGNPRARSVRIMNKAGQLVGTRMHEDPKARDWKATAQQHMEDARGDREPLTGVVALQIRAWKACPRSLFRKLVPRPEEFSDQKPDLDNVLKLVKDAANGVLWLDDRQVARVDTAKMRAEQGRAPGTLVRVHRMPELPMHGQQTGVGPRTRPPAEERWA